MDPQPPHPNEDPTPAQGEGSSGPPTAVAPTTEAGPIAAPANTNPNSAHKYFEHPLQALLVTVVALLFGFVLTQTNDRITRLEDKVDAGFAQQDAKVDAGFAQQDAKFDERFAQQDEKLDEINLKLTALIAALNATAEVEAALDGRLLAPNAATTDDPAN